MAGGQQHEHIESVQWRSPSDTGQSTRQQMVDWLSSDQSNQAYVSDGVRTVYVGVVRPQYGAPYIRTYADGVWTDNLLALPRF
jgi:hypothetical protein